MWQRIGPKNMTIVTELNIVREERYFLEKTFDLSGVALDFCLTAEN